MTLILHPPGYKPPTPKERDRLAREYLEWNAEFTGQERSRLLDSDMLIDLGNLPPFEKLMEDF